MLGRLTTGIKNIWRYKVEIAFCWAILILLVASALAYRSVLASIESERRVKHTHEVLNELDRVTSSAALISTASRGFALTGSDDYLRFYHPTVAEVREHLRTLRQLTIDNAEQQRSLPDLEALVTQKISLADQLIHVRRESGLAGAVNLLNQQGEVRNSPAFASLVETLKARELKLLRQRNADAERSFSLTKVVLMLGTFVALIITASAGIGVIRDNQRRRDAEEALFVEKERAQVTLGSIGDGVICADLDGRVTFLNHAAERMTGWLLAEAEGKPFADVFQIIDAVSRQPTANRMQMAIERGETMHLPANSVLVRRDGMEMAIEDSVAPIHDHDGNAAGAVKVFRDVSAARELHLKLVHAAQHDFLTGLPNRALLRDRIGQAIARARRHGGGVAVLYIDLDGFKQVNDAHGHEMGDALLQSVTQRLRKCIRDCDTVSRLGGDEFVVLLSEVTRQDDVVKAAQRILRAVSKPHRIGTHDATVGASIGISVFPEEAADPESLLRQADAAMYRAKTAGRGTYCFYSDDARSNDKSARATAP
jgi:diguanylate cyclase (GGDEF)-like protein/PAS domain S-box-containing protein